MGRGPRHEPRLDPGWPPLAVNATAGKATNLNADKLDGLEASAFLPTGGTAVNAANADKLDGNDASAFLPAGGTAANAELLDGSDSNAFARVGALAWISVTPAVVFVAEEGRFACYNSAPGPVCKAEWVNYGGGWSAGAYARDPFAMVRLKGKVWCNGCTADVVQRTIFTLPVGFRPAEHAAFAAFSAAGAASIEVMGDGRVIAASGATDMWITLDGIAFPAAP